MESSSFPESFDPNILCGVKGSYFHRSNLISQNGRVLLRYSVNEQRAAGYDFSYPAIGVTKSRPGVMAFTASGDMLNPSAGYASIDAVVGAGTWNIVPGRLGHAQDDGFTIYKA